MSNQQISKEVLLERLTQKYENSPWNTILLPLIKTPEFEKVLERWLEDVTSNIAFTPPMANVFQSFVETDPNELKVVFINPTPFSGKGQADGLALSGYLNHPTAKFFSDALPRDPEEPPMADLKYLAKQGVLMLNIAATCAIDNPLAHAKLWGPVTVKLLNMLQVRTGVIYVFLGEHTTPFAKLISPNNYRMFVPYPDSKDWNDLDVFNTINEILKKNTGEVIKW